MTGIKNTRGGGQKTRNCVLFLRQATVLQHTVPQPGPSYPLAYNPAWGGGSSLNSARICASGPEADVCLKAKKTEDRRFKVFDDNYLRNL